MEPLFPGEAQPLPEPSGPTWSVTSEDPPQPPPVVHAEGYEQFVEFAKAHHTDPHDLLDTWAFGNFIRKARIYMRADPALRRSATIFLGNSFNVRNPDLFWSNHAQSGLSIRNETMIEEVEGQPGKYEEVPKSRRLLIEGTVEAVLDADLKRFREFRGIVEHYGWTNGSTLHPV